MQPPAMYTKPSEPSVVVMSETGVLSFTSSLDQDSFALSTRRGRATREKSLMFESNYNDMYEKVNGKCTLSM
jgi:hypothetical protein